MRLISKDQMLDRYLPSTKVADVAANHCNNVKLRSNKISGG